jgi:5-formyltetrahydrofolate cyclo-ligase
MPNKSCLRTHYKTLRQNLAGEQRSTHTKKITDHIRNLCSKSEWKNIACFASHGGEPDLSELLDFLQEMGTRTLLPRINNQKQMAFHIFEARSSLESGPYGIKQPHPESEKVTRDKIDCFLVPLVSFDNAGNRLGMGGGYYDKYFATDIGNPQSPLFGVAFSAQRSEKILPVDELDVSLDGVITENGLASFTVLGGKYGS